MCDTYLKNYYKEHLFEILKHSDSTKNFSINISFVDLLEISQALANKLLENPEEALNEWNAAANRLQNELVAECEENCVVKPNVKCRIYDLPNFAELVRYSMPTNDYVGQFLKVYGIVVRMSAMKMLEYKRPYSCTKCKTVFNVYANFDVGYAIQAPTTCHNPECASSTFLPASKMLNTACCKDYQEIKIQETMDRNNNSNCKLNSLIVVLEDDLVDTCKPGHNVTICGVVKRRWSVPMANQKFNIDLVFRANHIQINNSSTVLATPEKKEMFDGFWGTYADQPLVARNMIVKSICPQIFGMHFLKLAIAVVLAGGNKSDGTSDTRADPHLLLVGDAGTGKSELLRFASKIIPRSVLTTGAGSTAAGLTVTALLEGGEWHLEGGALVLADGGICCIDEFNLMKEQDKTSIHEAMEQQTISVAKASIVCKLSTKCSIFAATNPKGKVAQNFESLSMSTKLGSPLLSRFDLVLFIKDQISQEWDTRLADFILSEDKDADLAKVFNTDPNWNIETLQAYFAIIRRFNPGLTEEATRILSQYYQAQRRNDQRHKARTTVRLLDSLVRLSQGHAKLMYHSRVEIIDAVFAVTLVEFTMQMQAKVFGLKFDMHSNFPRDTLDDYEKLAKIVLSKLELEDLLESALSDLKNMSLAKSDATMDTQELSPKNEFDSLEETFDESSVANSTMFTVETSDKMAENQTKIEPFSSTDMAKSGDFKSKLSRFRVTATDKPDSAPKSPDNPIKRNDSIFETDEDIDDFLDFD